MFTDHISVYFLVALCHLCRVFRATSSDVNSHRATHIYIKISTAKVIANAVAKTLPLCGELCQWVTMQQVVCPRALSYQHMAPWAPANADLLMC